MRTYYWLQNIVSTDVSKAIVFDTIKNFNPEIKIIRTMLLNSEVAQQTFSPTWLSTCLCYN